MKQINKNEKLRFAMHLTGAVQGVGFRPFVYRIAKGLDLKGYVINDTSGVEIEVEGNPESLDIFLLSLNKEKPPLAHIFSQEIAYLQPIGYRVFEIRDSKGEGKRDVTILPDIAACEQCLHELFAHEDRRFQYPFINCTNCGPRFTIIEKLPYDRPNTTMNAFRMCPECRQEYENPIDRRFHAQPNACEICGPHVSLFRKDGLLLSEGVNAIKDLCEGIKRGLIASVKGIGGFHLLCDAKNENAINLLRARKMRQEKPFAVMFKDLKELKKYAVLSVIEEAILISPEKPIVLVRRKKGDLALSIAPGLRRIGAFLPYTALYNLILEELDSPVVATSGNISDEPIVKDNDEAFQKLASLADILLIHNRPIKRRCDDSVVKVIGGFPALIRRSRGYAPLPVRLPFKLKRYVLAVGGFYKNTFAIGFDDRVIVSQHMGDIETVDAINHFDNAVKDLCSLYNFQPDVIVHDLHPNYETTRWALKQNGIQKIGIQHHFAHILSCMAENRIEGDVLGVAWDGTGYAEDATVWGGEFMKCSYHGYKRLAWLKPFRLLGGERAVREPRRVALSIIFEIFGEDAFKTDLPIMRAFNERDMNTLFRMWKNGLNSPYSSSSGRLFDAVASLLDIRQVLNYEGQAATMLEDLYNPEVKDSYPYEIREGVIDWKPLFYALLDDRNKGKVPARFINTLSEIILHVAKNTGLEKVCLSGGVFQNDPLTARVTELLSAEFRVFTNKKLPPNDGGISLGQAVYGGLKSELPCL